MITPVNGHLVIEPIIHEGWIQTAKESYEEIGVVVSVPEVFEEIAMEEAPKVGDKVFFDSWLAAKYPKPGGKEDEFFWLVSFNDVRAVERAE
jgi:hypothetical protein